MRTDIFRILAKNAKPGQTLCYSNPVFDSVIDAVEFTRDDDVKISTNNGTSSDFYPATEEIWVRYE